MVRLMLTLCLLTMSMYVLTACEPIDEPDPCNPSPCLNGGTCTPNGMVAECICVGDYVGDTCEFDLNDGLVAYYPFNDTASDDSGNGNDGTVYGVTSTADRDGDPDSAYNFDGYSYLEVPNSSSLQITNQISISAWINIGFLGWAQHHVVDKRTDYGTGYGLNVDADNIQFIVGHDSINYSSPIQFNTWYHVVGTYNGQIARVYVNDEEVGAYDYVVDIPVSDAPMYIGQKFMNNERFHGALDDVRIYNRALSETEIQALSNE